MPNIDFTEPVPGEAAFPYNEAGWMQMIAARKAWQERRDAAYMAAGYVRLPSGPLYISPNDGRIDLETEDGTVLLSFESFDEYSGIECKEGTLMSDWEAVEAAMSFARAERRQAQEQGR
jgi:hypothetical protein